MERMLREALEKWKTVPHGERRLSQSQLTGLNRTRRWVDRYPSSGLVLRVTTRDMPGAKPGRGWKADAFNLDYAWFKKGEARSWFAAKPKVGARHSVPDRLARRLVRLHLIDSVRGQVSSFHNRDVEKAELTSTVTGVDGARVEMRITGATKAVRKGRWAVRGFQDSQNPSDQERGFETTVLGFATYDTSDEKFVAFEMVALGSRWGATQFNGRGGDLEAAPVGVALTLSSGRSDERVAPARIWEYGW